MQVHRKRILVVDDEPYFAQVLKRAFVARGFDTVTAHNIDGAITSATTAPIDHVVLDLKLGEESGLSLIRPLLDLRPDLKILVLTGFANISSAVNAIKAGAFQYMSKPASIEEILNALDIAVPHTDTETFRQVSPSLDDVEWDHIFRALRTCHGNVSATARMLKMNLRTLQRKISAKKCEPGMSSILSDLRDNAAQQEINPPKKDYSVLPKCRLVELLRMIDTDSQKTGADGISFAAQSALNIIRDMKAHYIAPSDVNCLFDLLMEFAREGYGEALTYIDGEKAECTICNALSRHKN